MKQIQIRQNGFTLIELLVVISIIAALVGILSVAQRKVKIIASNLKQKAVFHEMEIGLELFSQDFDGYPDSDVLPSATAGGNLICGAQHLAEALVGRDAQGFDLKSDWYAPDDPPIADPDTPYTTDATGIKRRKPLYVEIKQFGMHQLEQFYENGTGSVFSPMVGDVKAPVLTDIFTSNSLKDAPGQVGTPILYYKADTTKQYWQFRNPDSDTPTQAEYQNWIYNYDDNAAIIDLGFARPGLSTDPDKHFPDLDKTVGVDLDQPGAFYRFITDESQNQVNYFRPFNARGYILISAGVDGIYGTKDDLTNFNY